MQRAWERWEVHTKFFWNSRQKKHLEGILLKGALEINSIELSPFWEANSHSASQEICQSLWNPKVHYRVYKRPPLVPFLSQMSPVHTFLSFSRKIHWELRNTRYKVYWFKIWCSDWLLWTQWWTFSIHRSRKFLDQLTINFSRNFLFHDVGWLGNFVKFLPFVWVRLFEQSVFRFKEFKIP
jgi:hypothetical protein